MAEHESTSITDEWYTPAWVFEAIGLKFDLDPCAAPPEANAPASQWVKHEIFGGGGLEYEWHGVVWLNPPFGKRNGIRPWLRKLSQHGNGIAIVPNRTATDWWQDAAEDADALLFPRGKIRFIDANGEEGKSPGYGNVLMAYGGWAQHMLLLSKIDGFRA